MLNNFFSCDDPKTRKWNEYCFWVIFIAVLLLTATIRIRLLSIPIERDEGEYAYAGQLILQGIPPYEKVYNMKMPGIYAAYALILAIFGQTHMGIHLGLLFINTTSVILIFLLAKELFDPIVGMTAGITLAILSLGPDILGYTANSEHFVVIFALAGILLLHKAVKLRKWFYMLSAGFMLGIAYMMKQHGVAFIVFAGLYLLFSHFRNPFNLKHFAISGITFSIGVLLPFAITCLVLWKLGVFDKFWFWTFDYARTYISHVPLTRGVGVFTNTLTQIAFSAIALWALAIVGFIWLLVCCQFREQKLFLTLFLVSSVLAVCPGFYFRPHYFIMLLPAVSMLTGAGIIGLYELFSRYKIPLASAGLLFFAVGCTLYQHRNYFFIDNPIKVSRDIVGANPYSESLVIAKFIQANSNPDDTIAVLGSEPQIYFYSHRRSATGYIYMYALTEIQPYALKMQEEMISQIEQAAPKFLIFVNIHTSWLTRKSSERKIFEWFDRYASEFYHMVGVVDLVSPEETIYRFGPDAGQYEPQSEFWIAILRHNRYSDTNNILPSNTTDTSGAAK